MKISAMRSTVYDIHWDDVVGIRIGSWFTQSTLSVTIDGQKWHSVDLADEDLSTALPYDLLETLKLYDSWMSSLMWSPLVYHAEDNELLDNSDIVKHFYRSVDYLERVIMKHLGELFPEKSISNSRS